MRSDEGASPHNTTTMRVIRGTYHHNGYSGIAAVNSATLVLEDPVLHDNHLASAPANEGGLTLHETVTAYIFGLKVRDDAGAGVYAHNTTTVTRSGVVSGVAQGNALADNWTATP